METKTKRHQATQALQQYMDKSGGRVELSAPTVGYINLLRELDDIAERAIACTAAAYTPEGAKPSAEEARAIQVEAEEATEPVVTAIAEVQNAIAALCLQGIEESLLALRPICSRATMKI